MADLRGHTGTEASAMSGALWLTSAVAAARRGKRALAVERVRDRAAPLAQTTGETNIGRTAFGPTNVALHLVSIALENGRAGEALDLADRIDPTPLASRERRITYALDIARGYALRREPGAALLYLGQAESAGSEEIRYNPGAHDTLRRVYQCARPSMRSQEATAKQPVIAGVLDFDRALWGDPAADWTIRMAAAKDDERKAFWDAYGPRERSPAAAWRARIYEARHLGALRLERHRLGNAEAVRDSYTALAEVLAGLV
ncbi:phosphotransferase family protein [Streptomonospora nanhaiensis]|uniref:hypothetical protein n=1 Tax=Streptomonospora nanhaiensis TaxID=1323731 RepID=UPI001C37EAD0|nr:hypothetical protein [Streptomonospora nanhaiensis]MBV2366204.1 hypothetical protein [Streptomonospora nanhaiensis]